MGENPQEKTNADEEVNVDEGNQQQAYRAHGGYRKARKEDNSLRESQ